MSMWIPVLILILLVLSRLALHPSLYASSSRSTELPDSTFEYVEVGFDSVEDTRRGSSKRLGEHPARIRRQLKQVGGGFDSHSTSEGQRPASLQVPVST